MERSGTLLKFALGEALNISASISALPVDSLTVAARREEHDSLPIGSPHGKAVCGRIDRETRHRIAFPLIYPDVTQDLEGDTTAIWREAGIKVIPERTAQRLCFPLSIHPIERRVSCIGTR